MTKSSSSKAKRGPAKLPRDGVKYNIDEVSLSGEPTAPLAHVKKWTAICGVVVRDQIPISTQEWHQPKEGNKSFVSDRAKNKLWDKVISYFTLPDYLSPDDVDKVKHAALKKMAIQFQTWKKKT